MPENEPNKVGVRIFETDHLTMMKVKTRKREEEKTFVDFADIIHEALDKLLGNEHKPDPWPAADRIWHQMLAEIFASVKDRNVPEKVSSEAVKAVKQNLRVFYRHIGHDPDDVRKKT